MAAAKKKAPARKQTAPAKTKVLKQTISKKTVKAKVEVRTKAKPKVTSPAKVVAKKKAPIKKQTAPAIKKAVKTKIEVKAKAKKTIAMPSKGKTVPQKKATPVEKPEKNTATKSSAAAPTGERFRGLKSMLIAKRDALLKEAKQEIQKYVSGENRQLVDTAIDEADWAAVEISEDLNLKRLSAQRQLLNDVEESLRKLNEGSYGICEDCGEEISEKRLRVIPTATLCIDCKEQREKMAILDLDTEI